MFKRLYLSFFISIILLVGCTNVSFADSSYVLPYPSYMPGNFMYYPRLLASNISKYIYFGDFGKFDYNLKESDHYLVEAKTLFEYKQYLLASIALRKSDKYFKEIYPNLENAKFNGKNISDRESILKEASRKHMEILGSLEENLPDQFDWVPEKSESTNINLKNLIKESINIRSSVL